MRYVALDVGNKRVGVAVGSTDARIATPLTVFTRSNPERDAQELSKIIREYDVEALVIGIPRNRNEMEGVQETLTRAYAAALTALLGLPIYFQDERYSTSVAMSQQRERGVSEKHGRATVDAVAAAVILQDFLDSH